jgi:mono/diheme cytochrome c family protein
MKAFTILFLAALLPGSVVAAEPIDYTRDVQPILTKHCTSCHGAKKQRSSLRLDSVRAARLGGNSGPALVPGKSGDSRLILAVRGGNDEVAAMPPKGPRLSADEVRLLRAWIDGGAPIPASEAAEKSGSAANQHWAFQPIRRPPLPRVKNLNWCKNAIDRFILARLEKEGIAPAPEADRLTLLRRLSLDLIGLPPSSKDIEDFLSDKSPDAYERAVDRLLASPHYGERWGRHWLDLARYADSNGYSIDSPRSIWKYRDWVIDALNKDKPFDEFVVEQLAGDLLPEPVIEQRIATGFHRNTSFNEEGGIDLEQFRIEAIIDRTNTTGTVFLGLTIGCCQCHDHKYDPISQREFYQLFAFFNSCEEPKLELPTPEQLRKRSEVRTRIAELEKQMKSLDTATPERVAAWEGSLTPRSRAMLPARVQTILAIAPNGRNFRQEQAVIAAYRNFEEIRHVVGGIGQPLNYLAAAHMQALMTRKMWEKKIADFQKELPVIPTTLVMQERKTPRVTNIHLGGDFVRKGAVVTPDVPSVLPPLANRQRQLPGNRLTRLDLARWLVDDRNPLTPRVTVNRFWQQYFGLGLVETENDFGTQGTPPSHPQLLDWLATEFRAPSPQPSPPGGGEGRVRGWSMKHIHRLIVTSATYRQSARHRPELATIDARNRLLARQNRLRLDAEVVRDAALSVSGLLCRTVGGPSVYPPQPKGVYAFTQIPRTWQASSGPDRYRRGLYTYFWRSAPHPDLTVFDAPEALAACTRRNRSNTPLQALTLLNDQGFFELAQALAGRILREGPSGDSERIAYACRLCLGRQPSERERQALERLLQSQGEAKPLDAWISVARVLLNLDEFITRE